MRDMTVEEEKALDRANRDVIRDILDTMMYLRDVQHKDVPPELKKEVIELIRIYGAICELEKKVS